MWFHDHYGAREIMPTDDKALGPEERSTPLPPSKDPLHGITLAMMLDELVAVYGWEEMGRTIRIRCFTHKTQHQLQSRVSPKDFVGPEKKWKIGIG